MIIALIALVIPQDREEVDSFLFAFQAVYDSAEAEADRAEAVRKLAEVRHPRVLTRLARFLSSDGPTVRVAAARGLAGFTEHAKAASAVLAEAIPLNEKNEDVQIALLDALGGLKEPGALPRMHALFDHKTTRVARAAVEAVGKAGRRESVDGLIALLARHEKVLDSNRGGTLQVVEADGLRTVTAEDSENTALRRAQALAPAAIDALRAITKQDLKTARDWAAWWARHREKPAASS